MNYPRALLAPQFLAAYREKEKEYRCPLAKRLFCAWPQVSAISALREGNDRCNTFLGQSVEKPSDVLAHGSQLVAKCSKRHRFSCRACGERIEDPNTARDHKCIPLSAADAEHEAFDGLKRGRDYQICPSEKCGRRVELSSGCNHIVCYCKQQFCFLCGEPAGTNSHHWEQRDDGTTACPRYNQPGSANAMFDYGHAERGVGVGNLVPFIDLADDDELAPDIDFDITNPAHIRHPVHAGMNADRVQRAEALARLRAQREMHIVQRQLDLVRARLMNNDPNAVVAINDQGNVVERVYRPPRMRYDPVRDGEPGPSGSRRQDGQRRRARTENDRGQQSLADGELPSVREQERAPAGAHRMTFLDAVVRENDRQRLRFDQQRRAWEDMAARADREVAERDANHQFPTFAAPDPADNNVLPGARNDDDDMLQFDNIRDRRHARVFPDPVPPPGFYDDNGDYNHPHPHPLMSNPVTDPNPFAVNNPAFAAHQHNQGQLLGTPGQTTIHGTQQHPSHTTNPFMRLTVHRHPFESAPLGSSRPPATPTGNFPAVSIDPSDFLSDSQAGISDPIPRTRGAAHGFGLPGVRSIFRGTQSAVRFRSNPRGPQPAFTMEPVDAALDRPREPHPTSMREPVVVAVPAGDDEPPELVYSTRRRRHRAPPASPGSPAQSTSASSRTATMMAMGPRNPAPIGHRQRMRNISRASRGSPEPRGMPGAPSPESDREPYQTGSTEQAAHSGDDQGYP